MHKQPRPRVSLLLGACLATLTLGQVESTSGSPSTGLEPMLAPGAPGVDARRIAPYTNQFDMIEMRPDGSERFVGTWDDRVEIEEREGVPILRRIQRSTAGDRTSAHFDEVDQRTLQPLRARYESNGIVLADATYQGRRLDARETITPAGLPATEPIPVTLAVEFPTPVFDWHLWGVLLSSFPLTDGYAGAFLAHTTSDSEGPLLRRFRFEVAGRESVDLGERGKVDCYVVRVDAGQPWTFWISTTRRPVPVAQLKIESPEGVRWWKPSRRQAR